MRIDRPSPSPLTWSLLIGALVLLAVTGGAAVAATGDMEPALEIPQVQQEAARLTTEGCTEPAVEVPAVTGALPVSVLDGLLTPSLVPNPCYQFDDPQTGCYYKWRPSDYCCVSPDPRCPSICY